MDELAYIAGLFDGEGHCAWRTYQATRNGKRYWRRVATITNTDKPILIWVRKRLGGLGSIHKAERGNKNTHKKPHWKQCWRLQMTHSHALEFLELMRPYCRIKAKAIKAVLGKPRKMARIRRQAA